MQNWVFYCIGEVNSLEILYGDNFKYEINQNILICHFDAKDTILIKVYLNRFKTKLINEEFRYEFLKVYENKFLV